jgi:putative transposase
MKRKRFSVEQIVSIVKQAEMGLPVAELIRRVGISDQTFYRLKKQYTFDTCAARTGSVSERHACKVVLLSRASHQYQSIRDPLTELRMPMRTLAQLQQAFSLLSSQRDLPVPRESLGKAPTSGSLHRARSPPDPGVVASLRIPQRFVEPSTAVDRRTSTRN